MNTAGVNPFTGAQAPAQGQSYNPFSSLDQTQAGTGEQYAQSALGYYGANGMPGYSNQAWDQFQAQTPADMSPYYNNAVNQTNNTLNQQLAARGMYGSSAGVGQIANADTNLRSQEAKDNAEYQLQRGQLAGSLGSSADQNQLAWTKGLGDIANNAQELQMKRGQNVFGDQMLMSGQLSGLEGSAYDQMFNADQQNLDSTLSALGVNASNNASASQGKYNQFQQQQQADTKAQDDLMLKVAMMAGGAAGL
jgi:hypothetical protein